MLTAPRSASSSSFAIRFLLLISVLLVALALPALAQADDPDITAPYAPTLYGLNGNPTSSQTPKFGFYSEPDALITIYADGEPFEENTVTADGEGNATWTSTTYFGEGDHVFTATATDAAGNTSGQENAVVVTIDLTNPVLEFTSIPQDAATTDAQTVAFTASDDHGISGAQCEMDGTWLENCTSPLSTADFGELTFGSHTLAVYVYDNAGNQAQGIFYFTIAVPDFTAPDAPTIQSDNGDYSNSASPSFSGTAEPLSTITLYDNGESFEYDSAVTDENGNWSWIPDLLSESAHSITATATDGSGNISELGGPAEVTVDLTYPTVEFIDPPHNASTTDQQTVTFTTEDNNAVAHVFCQLDDNPDTIIEGCAAPFSTQSFGALTFGRHALTIRVVDEAGNVNTATARFRIKDPDAPLQPPTIVSDYGAYANFPSFHGTADPLSTITLYDNGEPFENNTTDADEDGNWSSTSYNFSDGPHSFTATESLEGEETSDPSEAVEVTVDTISPEVYFIDAPHSGLSTDPQIFSYVASDSGEPLASVTCRIDEVTIENCASPGSTDEFTGLTYGPHNMNILGVDNAGNAASANAYFVLMDPDAASATPQLFYSGYYNASQTVRIDTWADPGAAVTFYDFGLPFEDNTAIVGHDGYVAFDPTNLAEGHHELTATALNESGHVSELSNVADFFIDLTPPEIHFVDAPQDASTTDAQTISWEASDENGLQSDYYCTLDGEHARNDCASPISTEAFAALTSGQHVFKVLATDSTGNQTWISQEFSIDPDATPPEIEFTSPPVDSTSTANQTFEFTATDNKAVASTYCTLDGGFRFLCSSPASTEDLEMLKLSVGSHHLVITAYDFAGNSSSAEADFTISEPAPDAPSIQSDDGDYSNSTSPPFSGTAEPLSTITLYDNGDEFENNTTTADENGEWSFSPDDFAEGSHSVTATATTDGGVSDLSDAADVIVDITEPEVNWIHAPGSTTNTDSQVISWEASDENGIVSTECVMDYDGATADEDCSSPTSTDHFAQLTFGYHHVEIYAADPAGNVGATGTEFWITEPVLDTTAPAIAFTFAPHDSTSTDPQGYAFEASDEHLDHTSCQLDDGTLTDCGSPGSTDELKPGPLALGTHHLTVWAYDEAGNSSSAEASFTISAPPAGPTGDGPKTNPPVVPVNKDLFPTCVAALHVGGSRSRTTSQVVMTMSCDTHRSFVASGKFKVRGKTFKFNGLKPFVVPSGMAWKAKLTMKKSFIKLLQSGGNKKIVRLTIHGPQSDGTAISTQDTRAKLFTKPSNELKKLLGGN